MESKTRSTALKIEVWMSIRSKRKWVDVWLYKSTKVSQPCACVIVVVIVSTLMVFQSIWPNKIIKTVTEKTINQKEREIRNNQQETNKYWLQRYKENKDMVSWKTGVVNIYCCLTAVLKHTGLINYLFIHDSVGWHVGVDSAGMICVCSVKLLGSLTHLDVQLGRLAWLRPLLVRSPILPEAGFSLSTGQKLPNVKNANLAMFLEV